MMQTRNGSMYEAAACFLSADSRVADMLGNAARTAHLGRAVLALALSEADQATHTLSSSKRSPRSSPSSSQR